MKAFILFSILFQVVSAQIIESPEQLYDALIEYQTEKKKHEQKRKLFIKNRSLTKIVIKAQPNSSNPFGSDLNYRLNDAIPVVLEAIQNGSLKCKDVKFNTCAPKSAYKREGIANCEGIGLIQAYVKMPTGFNERFEKDTKIIITYNKFSGENGLAHNPASLDLISPVLGRSDNNCLQTRLSFINEVEKLMSTQSL